MNTNIPELEGSDAAICLANLTILNEREARLGEAMLAVLGDLVDAILCEAGGIRRPDGGFEGEIDPEVVDGILFSLLGGTDDDDEASPLPLLSGVSSERQATIRHIAAHAGLYVRLTLCQMMEERWPTSTASADRPSVPEDARGRIAYMVGAFADEAFERFARLIPHARVAPSGSFVDACEEVRSGLCEYAILPLENTQSGKLTAFSQLILRCGLSIVAVCDLENRTVEGQVTRFALLQKATDRLCCLPSTPAAPLYLELLHTTLVPPLSELLSAATFCGLTLTRADTLPRGEDRGDDDDDETAICCVLNATNADLPTFSRYLHLEASEDILMGLYHTI